MTADSFAISSRLQAARLGRSAADAVAAEFEVNMSLAIRGTLLITQFGALFALFSHEQP